MRPGRRPLVAGAAGLVTLILFVGHPNFRHPGLTTRRLSDDAEADFARAQGEEVRLTGGAGDGYCFDTNSIHQGTLEGRKARYVVVTEFHSGIIEDAFSRHGLHFRSPFGLR